MKPKSRHITSLASLLAVFTFSTAANAQSTLYWDSVAGGAINDGTAAAWLGAGLWNNNGTPSQNWTSGDNAIFGNFGAGAAVTLGAGGTTARSLTFNYFTGTYTIGTAGNTLTIGSGGITKIAGSGALVIASPVVLSAAQTWTNNSTTGFQPAGAVTVNNGGFNLTFDGTGSFSMSPSAGNTMTISGAGGIIKNGTGDLNLDSNPTVAHSFTGNIVVNGGSIGFQTASVFSGKNTTLNGGYLGGRFNSSFTWTGGLGTGANQIQITGGVSGFSGESNSASTFQIGTALSTLKWGASGENGATGFFNPTALLLQGSSRMNANGTGPLNNGIDVNGSDRTFTSNHTNWDGASGTGGVINGAIVNTAGTAAGIIRTGIGNLSLIAANIYNGATTINGGTLTFRSSGTAANTTALNLGGGILRLVNTANTQRFADVAISATAGGGITYENTAGSVVYTESLGALTLTKGQVNVLLSNDHNAAAGSQTLTFGTAGTGNLTQGAGNGTITFSAPTTGLNATKNRVAVFGATGTTTTIIGPWATTGTSAAVQTKWATFDSSGFVLPDTIADTTVAGWVSSSTTPWSLNPGANTALTGSTSTAALRFYGAAATLDLGANNLSTNGIFFSGANAMVISSTGAGIIQSNGSGSPIYITAGQAVTQTITSFITNGGGTTALVKSGAGTVILNGAGNYSFGGNISVNAGTLQVGASQISTQLSAGSYAGNIFIGAGANFTLQGNATNTLSGVISGDGNLNLNRGTTTLSGANTYTGKTSLTLVATNGAGSTINISSFNSVVGGTASSSLGAPTTVANGTIGFGGGGIQQAVTINYTNASNETTDRVINFEFNGSGNRAINVSGGGLLKFTSAPTSNGTTSGSITLGGSGNGEFSQGIPFAYAGLITKSGASTWTLGGAVGTSGGVTLDGANAGSRLNINHGQALGTGTFTVSGGNNATIGNTSGADILITNNNAQTWSNDFAVVATNSLNMGTGAVSMGGATRNVTVTGAGTFTVGGVISATTTFGLTKSGAGTMTISGANTYDGATLVSAGTLNMTGNRTAAAGAITVSNNAILGISNGNFSLGANTFSVGNTSGTATVNHSAGAISFSGGTQVLVGNGTFNGIYNLSGGTLSTVFVTNRGVILGVNTGSTGTFNLSGTGTLSMASTSVLQIARSENTAAPTSNGVFNQTGGTATVGELRMGGLVATNNANATAQLNLSAGIFTAASFTALSGGDSSISTINISGTADVTLPQFPQTGLGGSGATAVINFNGGTLKNAAASTNYLGVVTTAQIMAGGAKFNTSAGNMTITHNLVTHGVSTGGGMTKEGTNTLVLSGTNTYTGATTISLGTLQLGSGVGGGTTGRLTATSSIVNDANLTINRSNAFSQATDLGAGVAITGTGSFTQAGAGTTTLTAANSYSGATTISAGSLQIGSGSTTGRLTATTSITNNANLTINRSDAFSQATDLGAGVAITGTGTFTQAGGGTTTLTVANTYTGATTVNAGTLEIATLGSTDALSAVTVSNSGSALVVNGTVNGSVLINSSTTLSGTGTINGAATVNGTHNPGTSPGIQTFTAGLAYASTATLNAEFVGNTLGLRGTDFDGVNVTGGNLNIDSLATLALFNSSVNYADAVWDAARAFTVIDFSGAGTSTGSFVLDTTNAGSFASEGSWSLANTSNDIILSWAPVPEPSSVALLGVLGGMLLLRRRR